MTKIQLHLNRDWFEKNKGTFLKDYEKWNDEFCGEAIEPGNETYLIKVDLRLDDPVEFEEQRLSFMATDSVSSNSVWLNVEELPLGERAMFSILEWASKILNKVKTLFQATQ